MGNSFLRTVNSEFKVAASSRISNRDVIILTIRILEEREKARTLIFQVFAERIVFVEFSLVDHSPMNPLRFHCVKDSAKGTSRRW